MSGLEKAPATSADRVLISLNPKAGRTSVQRHVDRLVRLLQERGWRPQVETELDAVARLANAWHAEASLRALVAVGGDGTIAELVNRTTPGVPIAVFPTGTANVLAKHFRLRPDPTFLADVVQTGACHSFDAARAGGRLFLLMAGCGFDAEVVRQVHQQRQLQGGSHIGYRSYAKPILSAIRSYQYPQLRVYWECSAADGSPSVVESLSARWAFVCNFPRYGWGLPLVPEADPADRQLDLCTFSKGSFWSGLGLVAAAQLGVHRHLRGCQFRRVQRVRIEADQPVPYQLDGDAGGLLPLDIALAADRWSLLLPGGSGR
jgi:diacylglycerol kinase (ATP)